MVWPHRYTTIVIVLMTPRVVVNLVRVETDFISPFQIQNISGQAILHSLAPPKPSLSADHIQFSYRLVLMLPDSYEYLILISKPQCSLTVWKQLRVVSLAPSSYCSRIIFKFSSRVPGHLKVRLTSQWCYL